MDIHWWQYIGAAIGLVLLLVVLWAIHTTAEAEADDDREWRRWKEEQRHDARESRREKAEAARRPAPGPGPKRMRE